MAVSDPRRLAEPIVDGGIRWLNFFNGRLLSAEDLRTDHEAIFRSRTQLGEGLGDGVVAGLAVSEDLPRSLERPVLAVAPGLAFDRAGRAVELSRRVTIGLVRVDAPDGDAAGFRPCDVVLPGTAGRGVYVLSVGTARADQGRAAVAGLGNEGGGCNTAYTVEGVRFALHPVDVSAGDLAAPNLLRNRVAYRMFGAADERRLAWRADPFAVRDGPYGLLDDLRELSLDDDVPLATLHWEPGRGLRFLDTWSVRRRPVRLTASIDHASPLGDRAQAEGEAMVLQFAEHIRDLVIREGSPASLDVRDFFEFLPPVGVVPMLRASGRGLARFAFFDGVTTRGPAFIEGAHLEGLLREGLAYPPIRLARREAIWLYAVREDAQRGGISGAGVDAATCLVFSTGHLRYRADARFDLGYWDYASFATIG